MSTPTTEADPTASRRKRERKTAPAPDAVPVAAPIKQRRRPALIGLGVALVALGGVGAAYLATSVTDTQQVIVINENVPRGTQIQEQDLGRADITVDPSLDQVPFADAGSVVGQVAAFDLVAGSILTTTSFTSETVPGEGEALVGVAVTRAQLPSVALVPGDNVVIVATPQPGDAPPKGAPQEIPATVVGVIQDATTSTFVVDVVLPTDQSGQLASWVATGRVVITLANAGSGD